MLARIHSHINKLATKRNFTDSELFLHLILLVVVVLAESMHIMLFVCMLFFQIWPLAIVNIFSMLVYFTLLLLLIKKQAHKWVGLLLSFEVIAYSLLSSYIIGIDSFVLLYFFLLLFMQVIIPYATIKTRAFASIVIWVAMIISLIYGMYSAPVYNSWTMGGFMFMSLLNVNLTFGGIGIELLASTIIQDVITKANALRMEEYKTQANTDMLTNLHNRRHAEHFFANLAQNNLGRQWCIAMLDIDDFKTINDTFGHPAGDAVLRTFADTMQSNLRKTDMLFRWGGEEFLLALADVDLESAVTLLDKMRSRIAAMQFFIEGKALRLTATIGVVQLNTFDVWPSISLCDKYLYVGKQTGKNKVVTANIIEQ